MTVTGFRQTITVDTVAAEKSLRRLAARATDLTPAMEDIGQSLVTSALLRFESERGPDGKPWRLLSAATLLRRLGGRAKIYKKNGDFRKGAATKLAQAKILQDRGHLRSSIHFRARPDQVEVGSNMAYARIHQLGGEAGRKSARVQIPARPYLGLDDGDRADVTRILRAFLTGGGDAV
ncbi:MAG: phage virion morphogenesis protein [Alphaproteobacteria bacterium]|nr:phage virion morphogenesis protein [Alphaproteobacteria bacterium]